MTEGQVQTQETQGAWRVLHWVRALGAEAVWALVAFLLCSVFLLVGLRQLFPVGTMEMRFFDGGAALMSVSLEKSRAQFQMNFSEKTSSSKASVSIATLSRVTNEVKHKKAEGIVWNRASVGFKLFERDAVQTLKNAKAMITFDAENFLEMDENSLVIIRRMGGSRILRSRRSFMIVVNGRLRGRIDGSESGDVKLQIALPTGLAEINTRDSLSQKTEFEINVLSDTSATVTVFTGLAKVSANGKTISVNANETTQINKLAGPAVPKLILNPVSLHLPVPQKIYYYRDFPPEILFDWEESPESKISQLQISSEIGFTQPILQETLSSSEFLYGNLKKGVYFWRVAAVDDNGVSGRWSPGRKIEVVQLLTPPHLEVSFPSKDEVINERSIVIRGKSDRQAKIYINGGVPQAWGAEGFRHELSLKKGMNLIVVESVDQAGNVSFERRLISRKY